uniref:Riboflavin transporter n=1 Tax=Ditylenchus dipsaci TaxID=166011 RepID=A0A915DT91_9BILA
MSMWLCLSVAAFIALHWFSPLILPATVNDNASVVKVDKKIDNFEQKTATTSRTADWGYQSKRFWFLLVCLALVCAQMNSIVPSIQSFSVMPYSLLTYHLALSLSNLAQPLACFLPFWLTPKSTRMVASLTGLSSVLCLWILVLAVQSPTPWLYYSFWAVCTAICSSFLNAYLRTLITSLLREEAVEAEKESKLFWCGVVMQIGSFSGSIIMFPLVNLLHIFESASACHLCDLNADSASFCKA